MTRMGRGRKEIITQSNKKLLDQTDLLKQKEKSGLVFLTSKCLVEGKSIYRKASLKLFNI